MKAVRLVDFRKPLELQEIDVPLICRDRRKKQYREDLEKVLVKVKACAVCGSDIHYWSGQEKMGELPLTLGHEISGVVTDIGEAVYNVEIGDSVVIYHELTCGNCVYCEDEQYNMCRQAKMIGKNLDGGFAEYIKVPERNLIKLPSGISFEEGCLIGCSMPTAYRAAMDARLKELPAGGSVTVYGTGGVGLHIIQIARLFGAGIIIGVNPSPQMLEMAKVMGADYVVSPFQEDPVRFIRERTRGLGARMVFDTTGVSTGEYLWTLLYSISRGGKLIRITLPSEELTHFPHKYVFEHGIQYVQGYGHLPHDMVRLISAVRRGLDTGRTDSRLDLSNIVKNSEIVDLSKLPEAFEELRNKRKRKYVKIIVKME